MIEKEESDDLRSHGRDRQEPIGEGGRDELNLSFREHVEQAVEDIQEIADDDQDHWRAGWVFVRALQAHPEGCDKTAAQVWPVVYACLPDPFSTYYSSDDFEVAFFDAWEKVRLPEGVDPLERACQLAEATPLSLPEEVRTNRPRTYPMFISLAGWLTVVLATDEIKLPVVAVSEVLNLRRPTTISRYRRMAIDDGYLTEIRPHVHRHEGQGEATTFRFAVARFPQLTPRVR